MISNGTSPYNYITTVFIRKNPIQRICIECVGRVPRHPTLDVLPTAQELASGLANPEKTIVLVPATSPHTKPSQRGAELAEICHTKVSVVPAK